jgi:WD40 repeat protein
MKTFFSIFLLLLFSSDLCFSLAIFNIRCSSKGRYVGITCLGGIRTIYDIENKKIVHSFIPKTKSSMLEFTPDEKGYLYPDGESVLLRNIETNDLILQIPYKEEARSAAVFSDMNRFLIGSDEGQIDFYNAEKKTNTIIKPKPGPKAGWFPVLQIMIAPDQKHFCTVTRFQWDDSKEIGERLKREKPDVYLRWLRYGIALWDASTMQAINRYASRYFSAHSTADYSSDGKYILGHTEQDLACLLDGNTGEVIWEPTVKKGHADIANPGDVIAFLSQGRYFMTMDSVQSCKLYLFDTQDKLKDSLLEYRIPEKLFGGGSQMVTDQTNNRIIIGTSDGAIQVYAFDDKKMKIRKYWKAPPARPLDKGLEAFYKHQIQTLGIGD